MINFEEFLCELLKWIEIKGYTLKIKVIYLYICFTKNYTAIKVLKLTIESIFIFICDINLFFCSLNGLKYVFYCCKQNRMNFYHEILTPCVLVMKASYQIESMIFFFLWNENIQILCSFWWHCSIMQKKLNHMQQLFIGWFCFLYFISARPWKLR